MDQPISMKQPKSKFIRKMLDSVIKYILDLLGLELIKFLVVLEQHLQIELIAAIG